MVLIGDSRATAVIWDSMHSDIVICTATLSLRIFICYSFVSFSDASSCIWPSFQNPGFNLIYLVSILSRAAHHTRSYRFYGQVLWVNTRTIGTSSRMLNGTVDDGHMPSSPVEQWPQCPSYGPTGTINYIHWKPAAALAHLQQ